jgi:hypothetical protein
LHPRRLTAKKKFSQQAKRGIVWLDIYQHKAKSPNVHN